MKTAAGMNLAGHLMDLINTKDIINIVVHAEKSSMSEEIKIREMVACPMRTGAYIETVVCNSCPYLEKIKWGRVFCRYRTEQRKEGNLYVRTGGRVPRRRR